MEHPTKANLFEHFGLFTLTASGALVSGTCRIEAGKFLVFAVETLEAAHTSTPTDSDRYTDCFDDHIRMCSDRHDGRPYHDPPMDSYQWHLMLLQ